MKILKSFLLVLLSLFILFLFFSVSYSIVKTLNHQKKNKIKTFREAFVDVKLPLYFEFIKWVLIDFKRGKDYLRLYGLWAFTGYYGEGKTLGCVLYAKKLQQQNPHRNIKIYSNIHIEGQDGRVSSWRELLTLPPNTIFIYDESQSDFGSTNLGIRDFPPELLRKLTQVRKKKLAIFATTPVYGRMNINMRESVHFVVESKNILKLDRLFRYTFYHADEYERVMSNPIKRKESVKLFKQMFAVSDKDYQMYNSLEEVDTIVKETDDVEIKGKNKQVFLHTKLQEFRDEIRNEYMKEMERMIRENNQRLK